MNKESFDYPFIRYPRVFVESPQFMRISIEARTLLAMILDRFSVSAINSDRFSDENGEIYVIYTVEEVCKKLGCGNTRTIRLFKELESEGMITRKRKSCCTPYRIYITQRLSEFLKQEFATSQNDNSRVYEIKSREFTKREDSYNNKSNNKFSNNHSSFIGFGRTEEEIREQIEYDCIVCDANRKLLDEMVMIISDVLNGTSPTVRIGNDEMPRGVVISRFCKLDSEHIFYVFSQMKTNTSNIRNMKPYLTTMLYNAPATLESSTVAEFAYHHNSL